MLTSLASLREDRGRPFQRREFIRRRTGRFTPDKLDAEVREFFAAEMASADGQPRSKPGRRAGRTPQ
jgi:hypothetical protein